MSKAKVNLKRETWNFMKNSHISQRAETDKQCEPEGVKDITESRNQPKERVFKGYDLKEDYQISSTAKRGIKN